MDEVIRGLLDSGLIRQQKIINAFRCFLVAKSSGAARFITDLSPWTHLYKTPPMRLHSAAEVLTSIPHHFQMIKIDLTSGFFQLQIHQQFTKFYGIQYRGSSYALQRLPMGHPLAPSILQRYAAQVASILHRLHGVAMVAYLDDWLIFGHQVPVQDILQMLLQLGITINPSKSILTPTRRLIYLGLDVNLLRQQMQPTPQCITHLK
jgi:hypothetical protein